MGRWIYDLPQNAQKRTLDEQYPSFLMNLGITTSKTNTLSELLSFKKYKKSSSSDITFRLNMGNHGIYYETCGSS